jgi:hypothetical protein
MQIPATAYTPNVHSSPLSLERKPSGFPRFGAALALAESSVSIQGCIKALKKQDPQIHLNFYEPSPEAMEHIGQALEAVPADLDTTDPHQAALANPWKRSLIRLSKTQEELEKLAKIQPKLTALSEGMLDSSQALEEAVRNLQPALKRRNGDILTDPALCAKTIQEESDALAQQAGEISEIYTKLEMAGLDRSEVSKIRKALCEIIEPAQNISYFASQVQADASSQYHQPESVAEAAGTIGSIWGSSEISKKVADFTTGLSSKKTRNSINTAIRVQKEAIAQTNRLFAFNEALKLPGICGTLMARSDWNATRQAVKEVIYTLLALVQPEAQREFAKSVLNVYESENAPEELAMMWLNALGIERPRLSILS